MSTGVGRRWWRRPRTLWSVAVALLLAAGALVIGVGWYFSDRLLDPIHPHVAENLRVDALGGGRITLPSTSKTRTQQLWGVQWRGGYGQMFGPLSVSGSRVSRGFRILDGHLRPGTKVGLDVDAYPSDPNTAFGLRYRTVLVRSPLGRFPAWDVPGRRGTWVIFVHGRGATRRTALRVLPTVTRLGFPSLDITYRNDLGLPQSADGLYNLGATEWHDLDAAAQWALAHGARRIVLVGWSMGGAIVSQFMHKSSLAGRIAGLVLDAPVLNWDSTVSLNGDRAGLPGFESWVAGEIASHRIGIDFSAFDQVRRAHEFHVPILLFHGTADTTVPIGPSRAFAAALPRLVTFVETGAGHVESWNVGPQRYDAAVRTFLLSLARR
jgi:alpha-beta hydrolase superfamily lysophospholipase